MFLRSLQGRALIIAVAIVAGLGIVFEGYDQGVMSGVNISPSYIDMMEIGDGATLTITRAAKQGGLVAVYYFGTLVGALGGGYISDKIGRIKTILIAGCWGLFGASLQTAAMNANWMFCARMITGVGTGGISAVIPVWSSELVSHNFRGALIAFEMVINFLGISISYWLEYALAFVNNGNTTVRWRFPIAFQMVPLLCLMVVICFMPESPRWDIGNGYAERGRKTLARLRGGGDNNHPDVAAEFDEIVAAVELESQFPVHSMFSLFTGYKSGVLHLGRRTQLALWLQIMQAWTGVTTVVVYAPTLFKLAGFSTQKADLLSGCNNLLATVSCILAIFTIDRFGRRMVLMVGGAGQSVAMFLLAALSKIGQDRNSATIGAAAGAFPFIYYFIFASTWLSVPWVYPTEIFPLAVRAKGNAFGIVGWSLGCGSVSLAVPSMFQAMGPQAFYVHAVLNLIAIGVVYCFYPETACRTLEEIDLLFAADTLYVWDAEKRFKEMKLEHSRLVHGQVHGHVMRDDEKASIHMSSSVSGSAAVADDSV